MAKYGIVTACIAAAACALLLGCTPGAQYRKVSGGVWGTTYHITYKADRDLSDSIVAVMRAVDLSLSPFEPTSLVSAVNSGARVKADTMLVRVMDLSRQVNAASGGMFDPTVAPLVNLWGFGYQAGAPDRPSQAQIDSALCTVGIADCGIDTAGYVVRKTPGTQFDFSAVAKGYGVDCIADMLRCNGCADYMVEVGGEMALRGGAPHGGEWRIQIDAPVMAPAHAVDHTQLRVIDITDACIATSGNYRNYRDTSEGIVGHTINPVTGYPEMKSALSATVIAPTTALADALATAVMVMPTDAALEMLAAYPGVSALIVTPSPGGEPAIIEVGPAW